MPARLAKVRAKLKAAISACRDAHNVMRARICELKIRDENGLTMSSKDDLGVNTGSHEGKPRRSKLKRMSESLHNLEHRVIEAEHKMARQASAKLMDVSAGEGRLCRKCVRMYVGNAFACVCLWAHQGYSSQYIASDTDRA